MNRRFLSVLASLTLVLAACGAEPPPESTTPTVPITQPSPEVAVLSYSLAAGQSVLFEVTIDQTLEVTTSGDVSALGEDDEVPEELDVHFIGTGTFTYTVFDGPTVGTFEVRLVGGFDELTVTGTMDGEPIDLDEIPDFSEIGPIDVTFMVDEHGNIIVDPDADGFLDGLFGLGALEGLAGMPGLDFGFFGPPLSDEPVSVGDSWLKTVDIPGMDDEVFTTEIRNTVTSTEVVDGVETLVIDTVTVTPLIEFDMADMFRDLFGAFLLFGNPDPDELAEFEEIMGQIRFLFRVPGATANARTWFDPEAGVSRKMESSGSGSFMMDVAMPDEETGEIIEFAVNMFSDQKLTYRLLSSDS